MAVPVVDVETVAMDEGEAAGDIVVNTMDGEAEVSVSGPSFRSAIKLTFIPIPSSITANLKTHTMLGNKHLISHSVKTLKHGNYVPRGLVWKATWSRRW
jgi:hypothetical protein